MKRKSTTGAVVPTRKQPRQDPVSCESCRKKKLKCDRSLPCSNCSARRISCSYGSYGPGPTSPAVKPGSQTDDRPSLDNRPVPPPPPQAQIPNRMANPLRRSKDDPLVTADWLETIVMGHRVPNAVPAPFRDELAQHQPIESPQAQNAMLGNISTLVRGSRSVSLENPATIHLASFLPSEAEAMGFLQYYCFHLDYQYHLIIPSRTTRDIHILYTNLARNEPVNYRHLALLFGIAATALFFQLLSTESTELAEMCSRETAFLAGAALIQSNHIAYPSIEGLQAAMIIGHHLSSLTLHPSISSLFLHSALISQAKSLGLHAVDSPHLTDERRSNESDKCQLELKRRLWWDLATYDWLLGFLSGPQEMTYTINPRHMNVRKPLHIEDEDIEDQQNEVPLSIPTCMSYTLQRLRLAEVCREIVDETAPDHLMGQESSYEKVLELDRKLHQAYAEIPVFFRFDQSSRREYINLYHERPAIAWQRAFIQQGYHSRLCRLHRPFFVRGAKDPRYSYSHIVSLQSARKVLEVKRIMDEEEPLFSPNSSFFWAVMHHVFMAAVILLIDVCFNWDDILAEKRKEEVLNACRMLTRAQQSSSVAREGISAMMGILRKHWKQQRRPPTQGLQPEHPSYPLTSSDFENQQQIPAVPKHAQFTPTAVDYPLSAPPFDQASTTPSMVPLEDLWTEMLDGSAHVGLDTPEWMDLLTELTNTTVPCE